MLHGFDDLYSSEVSWEIGYRWVDDSFVYKTYKSLAWRKKRTVTVNMRNAFQKSLFWSLSFEIHADRINFLCLRVNNSMPTNSQMLTVSEQNSGIHDIGEESAFVLDSSYLLYFSPLCRSFQFFLFVSGQNYWGHSCLVWSFPSQN